MLIYVNSVIIRAIFFTIKGILVEILGFWVLMMKFVG